MEAYAPRSQSALSKGSELPPSWDVRFPSRIEDILVFMIRQSAGAVRSLVLYGLGPQIDDPTFDFGRQCCLFRFLKATV